MSSGTGMLRTQAVVIEKPEVLALHDLALSVPGHDDVVVEIDYSGISTGTERLLFEGRMPDFPGMGYPLVPGYESVGRIVDGGAGTRQALGQHVFVPGSQGFVDARGLFGGAARRVVTRKARTTPIPATLAEQGVLLALAATACHALLPDGDDRPHAPDLIIGHGVVGRLLARLSLALGAPPPTVWETRAVRRDASLDYPVIDPAGDARTDYQRIVDASGDPDVLDRAIGRLARRGELVLAGFYSERLSFAFAPAFMREARLRIAAEWQASAMDCVLRLLADGRLSLDGLITDRHPADEASAAYHRAFFDPSSLKTLLDWRAVQ